MTAPPIQKAQSDSEVNAALNNHPVVFVFIGTDAQSEQIFEKIAYELQGSAAFIHLANPSDAFIKIHTQSASSSLSSPSVLCISMGSDTIVYDAAFDHDHLLSFIQSHRVPLIVTLTADNFEELTSSTGKYLALALHNPANKSMTAFIDSLLPLAKQYRSKIQFASVDAVKYSKWVSQFVDVSLHHLPSLLIFELYPEYVFKPDHQPQTIEEMSQMVAESLGGIRHSVASVPWYQPQKYINMIQKAIAGLSEMQLIIGTVILSGIIFAVIFFACAYDEGGAEHQPHTENQTPAIQTAAKRSAVTDKAKTPASASSTQSNNNSAEADIVLQDEHEDEGDVDDDDNDDTDDESSAAAGTSPASQQSVRARSRKA